MDSIAFFLDNSGLSEVDFSSPLNGNPGTGATEFMTVLVANELSKRFVDITLLTTSVGKFPAGMNIRVVKDIHDAILYSAKNKLILTIRAFINSFETLLEEIKTYDELKVVIWAHLTPDPKSLNIIAKTPQVKALICLENNQRVRMSDSLSYDKLLTIPYGITGSTEFVNVAKNSNTIAFIGALVPQKGFHLLADAWPQITKDIPNAKLYVFGTGQLYNTRVKLGPRGIATQDYEIRIFRNLDPNSQSVEFIGNANSTVRNAYLDKCRLGIVNPSAETETFCLSAVEFEQRGIPVIGGRKYGLLDTVKHKKTGYLIFRTANLSKYVIKLIKDDNKIEKYGLEARSYVLDKYNLSDVISRWYNLFETLSDNSKTLLNNETKRMRFNSIQALFVVLNRKIVVVTRGYWPSGIVVWGAVKKLRRRFMTYRMLLIKNR